MLLYLIIFMSTLISSLTHALLSCYLSKRSNRVAIDALVRLEDIRLELRRHNETMQDIRKHVGYITNRRS
jgi:hypothetical protein